MTVTTGFSIRQPIPTEVLPTLKSFTKEKFRRTMIEIFLFLLITSLFNRTGSSNTTATTGPTHSHTAVPCLSVRRSRQTNSVKPS